MNESPKDIQGVLLDAQEIVRCRSRGRGLCFEVVLRNRPGGTEKNHEGLI